MMMFFPKHFIERKIVELMISQKLTSKQIANLLFLSERTVEGHQAVLLKKLDL
jgi:DNA-binding CsgD family transcriptional regulator